jgi:hypothetical protein
MEVSYDISPEDYVAGLLQLAKQSPIRRRAYIGCWIGVPLTCAVAAGLILTIGSGAWILLGVFLAIMGPAYAVVHPLRYWVGVENAIRAGLKRAGTRGLTGRITLVLTDESVTMIGKTFRTEARWKDVLRVTDGEDVMTIFLTDLSGIYIPRNGFVREEEYDRVREFVLARVARNPEPDPEPDP